MLLDGLITLSSMSESLTFEDEAVSHFDEGGLSCVLALHLGLGTVTCTALDHNGLFSEMMCESSLQVGVGDEGSDIVSRGCLMANRNG